MNDVVRLTGPQAITLFCVSSGLPWPYPGGQQRLINAALYRRYLMNEDRTLTYAGWMTGRAIAQHELARAARLTARDPLG